jgi:hypothetical protein
MQINIIIISLSFLSFLGFVVPLAGNRMVTERWSTPFFPNDFFQFCISLTIHIFHLTMLSVLKLYSISDRIISQYGAVSEMRICKGNSSAWRKPPPVPPCPSQIPHDLTYTCNFQSFSDVTIHWWSNVMWSCSGFKENSCTTSIVLDSFEFKNKISLL